MQSPIILSLSLQERGKLEKVHSGRMFFWRRRDGVEVDFVIEYGRQILGIEVKCASKLTFRDTSNLQIFLENHPLAAGGLIVYAGNEIKRMGKNILAVPWTLITG